MPIIVAAVTALAVLAFGGLLTDVGDWYRDLRKPPWNPPNWMFAPAWTIILGLAACAGVLAWNNAHDPSSRVRILVLFGVNIVFQCLWSPLFFTLRRPDLALFEAMGLWLSVLALMIGLAPLSAPAAFALAPYLLWVSFAIVLNFVIVRLNRRAV